jgi:hypothetical protein
MVPFATRTPSRLAPCMAMLAGLLAGCRDAHGDPADRSPDAATSASSPREDASAPTSADSGGPVDAGTLTLPQDGSILLERENAGFDYVPPGDDAGSALSGEPVTLLVIFDKSGSMAWDWVIDADAGTTGTRWSAASAAMLDAIWPRRAHVDVGALLFPQTYQCEVPSIEDEAQIDFTSAEQFTHEWVSRSNVNGPSGGTPMEAAFAAASKALDRASEMGLLSRRFEVLLLTDGEPNCGSNAEALPGYAADWLKRGVRTHVMGLPGSGEAAELLQRIAEAGGSGNYKPIGAPQDLEDAVAVLL